MYVLRLTADDTLASSSADVTVKFNRAPGRASAVDHRAGRTAASITLIVVNRSGWRCASIRRYATATAWHVDRELRRIWIYTSYPGVYGADSFQFYVTDGMLTSAVATVSIQVTPISRGRTYTLNSDFLEGNIVNLAGDERPVAIVAGRNRFVVSCF